jgi:endonuclease/exonuclease/phosphatase family metal-dependent hydrolase
LRLLTWNLLHGRDHPPNRALETWRSRLTRRPERDATHIQVNQSLRGGFAGLLAGWEWDVALLQETPPRWLGELERATGATGALTLTSRNSLAPLRAAVADRNPDLIRSGEGGSNMLLVRPPARIVGTATLELARRPERRALAMAKIELAGGRGLVVANVHLSVPKTGQGTAEALRTAELATAWADGDPVVLGGDLNLRPADHRAAFDALRDRFGLAPPTGPRAIDHLLARDLDVVERPAALPAPARELPGPGGLAIRLSDHAPVAAAFGVR